MRLYRLLPTIALVIAITFGSTLPQTALAARNGADDDRPVRLIAVATTGPIGTINELAGCLLNGRFHPQQQLLWPGQIIRASDRGALLTLDSIGQVTLRPGAVARFSSATIASQDNASDRVLIASVVAGAIAVRLDSTASAYVEAFGRVYTSTIGASFRLGMKNGEPALDTLKGEVEQQQSTMPKYIIRPVARQGADLSVKARSTRQIQFQVTDEHDRPVPDVPVVLLLNGGGGQLSAGGATGGTVTATTNAQGVVTANFSAGATPATSSVTATVAGTSVSATVGVTTTAGAGILGGTTLAVVAGAVAAGTVATVVAVKKSQDNNTAQEPVQALPPTIIPKP